MNSAAIGGNCVDEVPSSAGEGGNDIGNGSCGRGSPLGACRLSICDLMHGSGANGNGFDNDEDGEYGSGALGDGYCASDGHGGVSDNESGGSCSGHVLGNTGA